MTSGPDEKSDFWSRRKAAVRQAEERETVEREAAEVVRQRSELEAKSDLEILEELDLPDPDTLTEKDDFSRFLSAAVPERLKRRALRRLWGLNPVLANLDGLVDYAEDYTDAATVISNMQTVYQVGKGMFDRFAEALDDEDGDAAVKVAKENPEETANNDAVREGEDAALHQSTGEKGKAFVQLTQADTLLQDGDLRDECVSSVEPLAAEEEELPPRRRRMRFDYS